MSAFTGIHLQVADIPPHELHSSNKEFIQILGSSKFLFPGHLHHFIFIASKSIYPIDPSYLSDLNLGV